MAEILVETGTGIVGANSYVTLDEADDYLSLKPTYSLWENLEEPENYLMWATRLLDQRAMFRGSKAVPESGLRWPRKGVCDRDGLSVPYDSVPFPIKAAVIEIAFNLVSQSVDPSTPSAAAGGQIKRIKADVLEIEYVEGTATSTSNYFPIGINDILSGLGTLQSTSGSKFGRILRA